MRALLPRPSTLLLLLARPFCAGFSSPATTSRVKLILDRPLRHLVAPSKKMLTLTLPKDTVQPLQSLRQALRARLTEEGERVEDQLLLRHGDRPIESDFDLTVIFERTAAKGVEPTLRVVSGDASALPPPPEVADPRVAALDVDGSLCSFFRFVRLAAADRARLVSELHELLASRRASGSVYVASEGVNGQLCVPVNELDDLRAELARVPGLDGLQLNVQHASLGTVHAGARPYKKLIVREKDLILTDGLADGAEAEGGSAADASAPRAPPLDWQRAGIELAPAAWHEKLLEAAKAQRADEPQQAGKPLLLDCRNTYESEAGTFAGAEPLGTDVFSESWEALRERLKDVPKDQPIMTFCTGGIRCVKTNAFLEQELGFTETYRLEDGIHGYLRHVREHPDTAGSDSQWEGQNFVFYEEDGGKSSEQDEEEE